MKPTDRWGKRSDLPGILEVYRRPSRAFLRRSRTAPLAEECPRPLGQLGPARERRRARRRAVLAWTLWVVVWSAALAGGAMAGWFLIGAALLGSVETMPRGAGTPNAGSVPRAAVASAPRTFFQAETSRAAPATGDRAGVSRLLDAIRQLESGDRPDPPDGDGGRSIGPYQIQRDYWTDAGVPWPYEAVRGEREGRLTVLAYWRRRAPAALAAGDLETLARLHNGGPNWAAKPATVDYWRRVLAEIEEGRRGR